MGSFKVCEYMNENKRIMGMAESQVKIVTVKIFVNLLGSHTLQPPRSVINMGCWEL